MQDLLNGIAIMNANSTRRHFAGPRDLETIAAAESALGRSFPPTYRAFLQQLGAGNFGAFEVYGITSNNFESAKVPNGIWLTLRERRSGVLPDNLLIIGDTGDGAYYCIELIRDQEARVVVFCPGIRIANQHPYEVVASDFGEFLLRQVTEELK